MKLSSIAVKNGQRVFWPAGFFACLAIFLTATVSGAVLFNWLLDWPLPNAQIALFAPPMIAAAFAGQIRKARSAPLDQLPQL